MSYLVIDPRSRAAAMVDPVLDFDPKSGRISTASADRLLEAATQSHARVQWILETHAHADHLSAGQYLRARTGARLGIGARIGEVQSLFAAVFNQKGTTDGREFDHLFQDGEVFMLGELTVEVIATPGHTPACISYRLADAAFIGDTLFMPDYGTARADFPGGDARTLYRSIRKLLSLPPATRLFLCHDYRPEGRQHTVWETTVAAQRQANVHIRDGISEDDFVAMREQRDASLASPVLLLPSIQVNIRAGRLPDPEDNGTRYLKFPLRLPASVKDSL